MNTLLSIRSMNIKFVTPRGLLEAVRDVSLDIPEGASVGIVGESGSGKTVMSRAAMGLLSGSNVRRDGTVVFAGKELTAMTREEVRQEFGTGMAMIFQDPMTALNPVRRIGAQLAESLRVRLGMDKATATARCIELLSLVRIPDPEAMLRKFPYQLSGGMRQRVMIAIAISCNPKLLFADEPTSALDWEGNGKRVARLLQQVAREYGTMVLIVSHDPRLLDFADRVLHMDDGRLSEPEPKSRKTKESDKPDQESDKSDASEPQGKGVAAW